MADEIKAETEIAVSEDVADNVVAIGVARAPHKKSFIETGVYAANILATMGGLLVNVLQDDEFSAFFNASCGACDNNCASSVSIADKGIVKIKVKHYSWKNVVNNDVVGCVKQISFEYDLEINTRKNKIAIGPKWEQSLWDNSYKTYNPNVFFEMLEQDAAEYRTETGRTAVQLYDDFCTLPERFSAVLIPIKENHERVQRAAEDHYQSLLGLEKRLLK